MKFTHLHVHSHYSLLDGLAKIDQILDTCQELKMPSIALTDHGSMYGLVEFYQKAKKRGIRPILGNEVYVTPNGMLQKRPNIDNKRYHLVLLVKDLEGYRNLVKLTTKSYLEGFYYKPRIDKDILRKYSKGLIGLSACIAGEIPQAIIAGNKEKAEKLALEYQNIFGPGNFYLEIQSHPNMPDQAKANQTIIEISKKHNIPLVATNDSHYVKPEDSEAQDVLISIQIDKKIDDADRLTMKMNDLSLRSTERMIEDFKDTPEAITNTQEIAQKCNFNFEMDKTHLPHFDVPNEKTTEEYLKELCQKGLQERKFNQTQTEVLERLDYELGVIQKTGFASYFLIVADLVNWAKSNGVVVGPGRGSAAGSIVSYLLKITDIDPLKYDLLFERFLNPERISMPDIDLDFADNRRDKVIEYVREKYGQDRVAQIITFGTMAARAAIRDAGRAMSYSYIFCDQIAKMIPFGSTLEKAIHESQELYNIYQSDEGAKKLIDMAKKLEGVVRHASTHACGIVITKDPLEKLVPCQRPTQNDQTIVTQYEMKSVEGLGLLKMDFLGLRNLTVIQNTLNQIKESTNQELDLTHIPLDDKETFELFQKAQTTSVFQLESNGMKRYLKQLRPTKFEDIIAMVALYRPGPIEFIPDFIARKHGLKEVEYFHPKLKPILENTYGVMIYQEQLMRIARDLAGFSLSEADVLRKAVGKKIKKLLDEQKEKMINGMVKNGIEDRIAKTIWQTIEPFAQYGFNRCLTGDTEIVNPKNGKITTIKEISERKSFSTILSCNERLKLKENEIVKTFQNGIKPVYKITTRLGKEIKATSNHPFLTINGWEKLSQLKVNDRIGLARKIPIKNKGLSNIKDYQLIVLGYLLAEGNLCHPVSFYFYSTQKKELDDYTKALEKFKNTRATFNRSKIATSVYAARINKKKISEAVAWVGKIGMRNKNALQKEFPDFVFQLNKKQLSLLLGKMFQGDGCINDARKHPQIFYATSSLKLARQLQHLFLRLDIITSLHHKKFKYRDGIKNGYTLTISRYSNIYNLYHHLGNHLIGRPKKTLEKIIKEHPIINGQIKTNSARGSHDTIPIQIRDLIRKEIYKKGFSLKAFAQKIGISERLFWMDKKRKGYLRETLDIIAKNLNSQIISDHANSDIYWDTIKKIESIGKEKTYDLTIKNTHNFLANDFIVHNSHSACYALIGYQTAYLKSHYPTEFMAATLASEQGDIERVAFLIDECKQMDINVLPPNINQSSSDFSKANKKKTILFGLNAVKNVGHNIVSAIVSEREKNGSYESIADFVERVESKDLNKKSLESLIKCGALDDFGERNQLLSGVEQILSLSRETQKAKQNGQVSLFSGQEILIPSFTLPQVTPASKKEFLSWEKELLGLYISEHPLERYKEKLEKIAVHCKNISNYRNRERIKVSGVINRIKKINTRSGEPMLFVEIEDTTGKIETIVFPTVLEKTASSWQEEKIVLVGGRVSDRDNTLKILCDNVKVLE